jgi:pyruvate dehydrogenase E2 component (dihydrolipoamide acetyltransferase)
MVTPILLPKQGNSVETCNIVEWKKKKGEEVIKGEVLCDIETDKAVFEIESPGNGILLEIFFNEGDEVPVLTNIAVIGSKGEDYKEFIPGESRTKADGIEEKISPESKQGAGIAETKNANPADSVKLNENSLSGERGISPRAKNLAGKLGISKDGIQGTGPGGRIIERDILEINKSIEPLSRAAKDLQIDNEQRFQTGSGIGGMITTGDINNAGKAKENSIDIENVKVVPLKGIRKLIAERMLESLKNSAQLTLNSSADAASLLSLRKRFKSEGNTANKNLDSITINDLIQYAVIKVLPDHPDLNSLFRENQIEYYKKIHLGFAVDTPRGLMVPVIRNAQDLSLLQLSLEAKRLASECTSGKINPDELNGGTFTITNLGNLGIESFTPVLNLPQTAILGINTITLKPVDNGKSIKFVPHISFSLTIDHRVIDGAVGARFLQSLAAAIAKIDLTIINESIGK